MTKSPEQDYHDVYNGLLSSVDALITKNVLKDLDGLTKEQIDEKYDALEKDYRVDFNKLLVHHSLSSPESSQTETVNMFLERMVHIRKTVLENQLITYPLLRSIHQADGISSTERDLVDLVNQRDQLAQDVLMLEKEIDSVGSDANAVRKLNKDTIESEKVKLADLLDLLGKNMDSNMKLKNSQMSSELADIEEQITASSEKVRVLAGVTLGVITSSGLNWGKDAHSQKIVLDCGSYEDEVEI
ncbi:unnamed protein product [Kuraishia capsulata CBS 1993]|uniref:Centromere protein H C-terminal domain-containing protein n=1 Tax=Kuraishia capsulata CBS 1993 TaxID=1382522 RepID=W6MKX9_9ASCO|nr:uncharacterized protein KUCA_T00003043001 [Kuraishia capsulata CBS 1993]CDK27066.1 unnamed protein product [Kuraishia capsulata CBS 1993]